jgi:SAM-dependent methyltransferase
MNMIWEFFIIKAKFLSLFKSFFPDKNKKVLDLGCGSNPYYHKCIKCDIYCLDIKKTKISDVVGTASSLPFKDRMFDAVISVNSFYYFNNPFDSIKEVSRILKKNGKLLILMPFIYPIHDAPHDKYRFTEYGIRNLLKEDFIIKRLHSLGGIFNLPAVMFHSLIKGARLMVPKPLRFITYPIIAALYPFYIIAQIFSLLDFLDNTGRWATYYFVFALKK